MSLLVLINGIITSDKSVWKNYFDYALNLGIRGDRVENVL